MPCPTAIFINHLEPMLEMLKEIALITGGILVLNVLFWLFVIKVKNKSERLNPIVIDDEGDSIFRSKKAFYHGTFDLENIRIFSNGLFAKGRGIMRLTNKYLIFKKKLSRKDIVIPLRYVLNLSTAVHPKKNKPMLNVHWQNGNVELISRFTMHDEEKPEQWIKRINEMQQ
jgi:hypothetical protein